MSEKHPYLTKYFDAARGWKYLIIGTFPPNKAVREHKDSYADYFYGNKGTLWKIIERIYPTYNFSKTKKEARIALMRKWQEDFNVGIADTILECSRRDINSSEDADLIIEWNGYNHELRDYLIKNVNNIEKVLFTSSTGCNSAWETFKIIMGDRLTELPKTKLAIDLPSPSGSSNTAMFNVNTEETLGLHPDLFAYVQAHQQNTMALFRERWRIKKRKLALKGEERKKVKVPGAPKGILVEYKIWKYGQVLPKIKVK